MNNVYNPLKQFSDLTELWNEYPFISLSNSKFIFQDTYIFGIHIFQKVFYHI